jgi:hypothetical protein
VLIQRGHTHEIRNTRKEPLRTLNVYVPPAYTERGEQPQLRSPCPKARRDGDTGKDTTAGMPVKAPSGPRTASGAGSRPRAFRRPQRGAAAQLRAFADWSWRTCPLPCRSGRAARWVRHVRRRPPC